MSGPMSDEQLAEIQQRWALARAGEGFRLTIYDAASPGALNVALHEADNDVTALLAEVDWQRARADHAETAHDRLLPAMDNLGAELGRTEFELRQAQEENERLQAVHACMEPERLRQVIEEALIAYWALDRERETDALHIAEAGSHAFVLVEALRLSGLPIADEGVAVRESVREAVAKVVGTRGGSS
ncbi:hypothetical protein ACQEU3_47230 [Spirillospora sp. CA-253888]